jgi:hypothetical protein
MDPERFECCSPDPPGQTICEKPSRCCINAEGKTGCCTS